MVRALPPHSCCGSWFRLKAHLWKPHHWKWTNTGVHNNCWEMPTNIAATPSFTLTYGLPQWQIKGCPQSRGHVTPFLHLPLSKVWLLPRDAMDTISTRTWGLPDNKGNTKICAYCFLFRLTPNHDCSPNRCPDVLSPLLLASTNPSLCPLTTIWSLPTPCCYPALIPKASSTLLYPRPPLPCSPMPLIFVLHIGCWQNRITITSYGHVSF